MSDTDHINEEEALRRMLTTPLKPTKNTPADPKARRGGSGEKQN